MIKRIVVCLDGTWNTPAQEQEREDGTRVYRPTNVLKVARAVKPLDSEGVVQLVYYDTGLGAMSQYPGATNATLRWFDSKLGGAWGAGFEGNVDAAYRFIAHNYVAGDEVFVFGYSRGAAQAQALCAYIDWMRGIPEKGDIYYLPKFFLRYLQDKGRVDAFDELKAEIDASKQKLQPFRSIKINFLGLWDTVLSLGSRVAADKATSAKSKRFLVKGQLPECVLRARHALAIDERRKDFRPEIWRTGNASDDMQQMWFPGGHGNVGGGRSSDGLANTALRWIVDSTPKIAFDNEYLNFYGQNFDDKLHNHRSLMYKLRDIKSFWNDDHGSRDLVGYPVTANIGLHDSVFCRLHSGRALVEFKHGNVAIQPYRPENLLDFLEHSSEFDGQLPDELLEAVRIRRC